MFETSKLQSFVFLYNNGLRPVPIAGFSAANSASDCIRVSQTFLRLIWLSRNSAAEFSDFSSQPQNFWCTGSWICVPISHQAAMSGSMLSSSLLKELDDLDLCILLLLLHTLEGEIILRANLVAARDPIRSKGRLNGETCKAQRCAATII